MDFHGDDGDGDGGGKCRRIRTRIKRKRSGRRHWWMRSSSILINVLSLPLFLIWMKNGNNRSSCHHGTRCSYLFVDAAADAAAVAAANLKQANVTTPSNMMNESDTNTTISDQPSFVPSDQPSFVPSFIPSEVPSDAPSVDNTLPPSLPPIPEQPDLEPIPTSTWTNLARQFFRIDVSAGPKTRIPSNAVQAVRMRANGTQNYQCQQVPTIPAPYDNGSNGTTTAGSDDNNGTDTTSYKMAWVLRYPLANLWLYSTINGTVNVDRPPDGIHYAVGAPDESAGFANLVWDLGTDCHPGDPLYEKDKEGQPPSCSTYHGRWRGKNPKSDPQVGTIAFLRLDKDETKMDPKITVQKLQEEEGGGGEGEYVSYYNALWQYSYMQRLRTFGGLVLTSGVTCESMADVNKTVSSVFEADFILSLKQVAFPPGVSGDVRLPDDCFQAHPFYAQGYVDYENRNGTWVPVAGGGQQAQLQDQESQAYYPVSFTTLHAYSTVDYANRTSTDDFEGGAPSNIGQGPRMKVIPENEGGVVGHNSANLLDASMRATTNNSPPSGNATFEDLFLSFEVDGDCNSSDRICQNVAGSWDGFFISSEQQYRSTTNLPLGLATVSSNIANTSRPGIVNNMLAPYHMVQQLLVRGGTAPPPPMYDGNDININNNADTNQTNSTSFPPLSPDVMSWNNHTGNDNLTTYNYRSEFNCSFVFALCVRDVRASTPPSKPVSSSSSSAGSNFPYFHAYRYHNSSQLVVLFLVVVLVVLVFIDATTIIQVVC